MVSSGLVPLLPFSVDFDIQFQDKIGLEKIVIHAQLYSNATQLNKMGTKKCWGIWLYVGNIPQELQISHTKKGAAILLGHIPEVFAVVFITLMV